MIPFQDNIPSRRFPVLTVLLIVINALIYVYEVGLSRAARERLIYRFALIPREFQLVGEGPTLIQVPTVEVVRRGQVHVIQPAVDQHELPGTLTSALVPLVTSMFLHASWMHLIGNMWFLWLFGDNVEDRLGRIRFLFFYMLSGLVAGGSQVVVNWGESTPILGASGAVAGVLGAYLITYPYARVRTIVPFFYFFWPVVELPAFVFLGFWLLLQFLQAAMSLATPGLSNVAWWAHVGGFVAGILFMKLLAPDLPERHGPTWTDMVDYPD
jgi:membrane associated rhomboid family serine protease